MSEEEIAHLQLLALFEGGTEFWSQQYRELGALNFLEAVQSGAYVGYKKSGARYKRR